MKKILFVDRDGTIVREPAGDMQVDSLEKLHFLPGVIGALRDIVTRTDYRLVMVSNQDGLGTEAFPLAAFLAPHRLMLETLAGEGVVFDEVLIDDSFADNPSPRRKPATGMVERYMNELLDRENSFVIGDRLTDMQLAANMGIRGILLTGEAGGEVGSEDVMPLPVAFRAASWEDIRQRLVNGGRRAEVSRSTTETSVRVAIDLDGEGRCTVRTGIAFFDHMLQQIARHGGIDLDASVKGDLRVDEHHTIEDTALALGACFRQALGGGRGIERYAFVLPMDEARATVALDLGGRAWLEWDVNLQREYVGDFPTEMTRHFFASFCQEARCTLHAEARGENTHHVVEALFKAFARCLGVATRRGGTSIPSSKGVI
ncbi:MAG: bifunctional histidinol-phosphatase/imidazoleglycerol-phosphate dehydratase HisB [Odoribacteraceae bacterium]|nr:bifunctional histidinol-phosphatase/imidazoleglycerol-phosphate dehydratase HisB [Odoribacteraceae bacterium]